MNATQQLHDMGQSLWLDNITRGLLTSGTLRRYIDEYAVTGLTSNPTIFDHAIKDGDFYGDAIRTEGVGRQVRRSVVLRTRLGRSDSGRRFIRSGPRRHGWCRRVGVVGGLSLARGRHCRHHQGGGATARPRQPPQSLHQDSRHSRRHSRDRGIDLRRRADQCHVAVFPRAICRGGRGLYARHRAADCGRPRSESSIPWRRSSSAAGTWRSRTRCRRRCAIVLASPSPCARTRPTAICWQRKRWQKAGCRRRAAATPAMGQHRDQGSRRSDVLYIEALAAPETINTMPEKTLLAFADHGKVKDALPVDGRDAEAMLAEFSRAGIDDEALAGDLQREGTAAFAKSWHDLLNQISAKIDQLTKATPA